MPVWTPCPIYDIDLTRPWAERFADVDRALTDRAQTLLQAIQAEAGPEAAQAVHEAHERLVAPGAMGRLFKALAVTAPGLPLPAGFEDGP